MADTLNDIIVPEDSWLDVSVASGIATGTALTIQNKGTTSILIQISATQPNDGDDDGPVAYDTINYTSLYSVSSGENKVWIKSNSSSEGLVNIQEGGDRVEATIRDYESLSQPRVLTTTLTQTEVAILEGDFFRSFQRITLPSSGKSYVLFTSPDVDKVFGLRFREITSEKGGVNYNVYRTFSGVTEGLEWDVFNENGYSPKISGTSFKNVTGTPTTIDTTSLSETAYIPPTGQGNQTSGSLNRVDGFKLIPANTSLLLEYENLDNTSNELLLYYQWVEAPSGLIPNP